MYIHQSTQYSKLNLLRYVTKVLEVYVTSKQYVIFKVAINIAPVFLNITHASH